MNKLEAKETAEKLKKALKILRAKVDIFERALEELRRKMK